MPKKLEKGISGVAIATYALHLAGILAFVSVWLATGHEIIDIKHIVLFEAGDISIFIDFYFDMITAVFAVVGSVSAFFVGIFSKYYMHRDWGYQRYFTTILLFFLGYNLVVFSGNFETLFIGWEILGVCSFLMIAFYRDRYLPVKNSLKVISIYRLGDICLILAMWMSHHLWHENIVFSQLNDQAVVEAHFVEHQWYAFFIALMILVAAIIKSAQFPFASWLPRAMEGPTTSSAIFYGALSVHLGVFLLLRTYTYWESLAIIQAILVGIGALTCFMATHVARVQSSVKTQIAYASIAQIGLIFIEIAFGFHALALIHFAGNAFFRTYQLLVSPSVLGYRIHDMFFNFKPLPSGPGAPKMSKWGASFYILSVKEWNLDFFLQRFLWDPFKWAGKSLGFMTKKVSIIGLVVVYLIGQYCNYFEQDIHNLVFDALPHIYSVIGLILILTAFAERGDALMAWGFVVAGQLFILLSITLLHEDFGHNHILLYLSGFALASLVGFVCLIKTKSIDNDISLNQYHGYAYERPVLGFVFLLACLGLVGLPFTPTFIGIDILFNHIHKHEEILIASTALSFVFLELSILRIYSRIFMGQHKKNTHAMAYRSS